MNIDKIKQQVKKAISLNPTHIILKRIERISNGMNGWLEKEINIGEMDIFLDDSSRNYLSVNIKEEGQVNRFRSLKMYAVTDTFKVEINDFFILNNYKYKITYVGEILENIYVSDLEMVK